MTSLRDVLACEARPDRAHNEQAMTVGVGDSFAATTDHRLATAMVREVIAGRGVLSRSVSVGSEAGSKTAGGHPDPDES